jgi:hypothetical protein
MKGRESGMPEESDWEQFFDAGCIIETMECARTLADAHSRQLKVWMMDIACWLWAKRYFHKGSQMLR